MKDSVSALRERTTRTTEAERLRRRLEHREDQLRKSRRFTALVGALGLVTGMVFQFLISAPPVWIGAL